MASIGLGWRRPRMASPTSKRSGFELGCNYWPRKSAMGMWRELDLGEIREDFAHIYDLGFRVVRFFLLTQDFLPAPRYVPQHKLDALVEVARVAKEERLRSVPALVTLNTLGKVWWPAWMRDPRGIQRNLYADPTMLRSQAWLVETCARLLAGDASIRAFDLANEIDAAEQLPSRDAGWLWAALLAGAVRRAAPGVAVRVGTHLPSLKTKTHLRIDDIAKLLDDDCMHASPLYGDVAKGPLDAEFAPFAAALSAELAGIGRPPLLQEFGICTSPPGSAGLTIRDDVSGSALPVYLASEEEGAQYYEQVLTALAATGAAGGYAWCYGDYDPKLFDAAPFDTAIRQRSFGLVRADGSEKPACRVVRDFAARLGRSEISIGLAPKLLQASAEAHYESPEAEFVRLYERWLDLRGARGRP